MNEIESKVRAVLAQHGHLSQDASTLPADADLPQMGMTSHASVNVMLGLESAFDVEFPDHMLTKAVFSSVASITAAIAQLTAA